MRRLGLVAIVAVTALAAACDSSRSAPADSAVGSGGTHVRTMTIHIDPAATTVAKSVGVDLTSLVQREVSRVEAAIKAPPTTIAVTTEDATLVIPEIGVGGFADPRLGTVTVAIDPHSAIGVATTLRVWLPLDIDHELDHSARILDGPGYGGTLRDAMVSEGLADGFSRSLHPAAPPIPWDNALSSSAEHDLWARAQPLLNSAGLARSWLFGDGEIPRWSGYTIGAHLVAAYHSRHPEVSWTALTRLGSYLVQVGAEYSP